MAITIPQYGQAQVSPQVFNPPRANEQAPLQNFGGGEALEQTGQAIQGLEKVSSDIFVEKKKAADDAVGQDVYARLTQKKNQLIYDPQNGAMTKKGQNALNVVNDYSQQFEDYSKEVSSSLSSDEQRRQFEHFKRAVGSELNQALTKHTYSESQDLQKAIGETALKTAQDDAVLNYHEPGKIDASIDLQTKLLTNSLKKAGKPQEVIDQQIGDARTKTYAGVIDRMIINGEDVQAKAYYNQVKDKMTDAKTIEDLEKNLEAGSMRGESQRKSDEIVRSSGSLSAALEKSRKIENPKLRDETTKKVKEYFSDQDQARKIDDESRFNSASQILEKSGGNLDSIPPQILASMSSANRRALEQRSTQIKNGVEPASNGGDFYNLQQMAVTPELRDKFLALNLLTYRHAVTRNELSELMKIQSSLRKSDGQADDAIRGLRTRTQVVNETIKQLGVEKDPDAVLTINRELDDQIGLFNQAHGKKPNGADVQKMLDNIVVKAKDPNSGYLGFFKSSGSAYTFDPHTALTVDIQDIPRTEREQIEKALAARHIPVTEDKIIELYSRRLNTMRQRGGQ